jgi:hypothetical protein
MKDPRAALQFIKDLIAKGKDGAAMAVDILVKHAMIKRFIREDMSGTLRDVIRSLPVSEQVQVYTTRHVIQAFTGMGYAAEIHEDIQTLPAKSRYSVMTAVHVRTAFMSAGYGVPELKPFGAKDVSPKPAPRRPSFGLDR